MKQYTVKVFENRTEWYNQEGQLHRDEGPAYELFDGTKEWFKDGYRHRDGGPAITSFTGAKSWYKDGKLHRDGGPAIEYADGTKSWYLNGEKYTEKEYYKELAKRTSSCNNKIIEMDGKKYKLVEVK